MCRWGSGVRYAAVMVLVVLTGCGARVGEVARVGDRGIAAASLQAYLEAATGVRWQAVEERVASRLLDQFLDQEVLVAAAGRDSLQETPDPQGRAAVVRGLLDELCGPAPPPSVDAVEKEIARRSATPRPARAHVRQMLLDSEQEAAAARQRVLAGESFVAVSRQVSRAPNAEGGGELGYLRRGTLPPDLDDVIFALKPGGISLPVPSPAGYHIFQVLEVVPEGPPDRGELEAVVRRELADDVARSHVRGCVQRLAGDIGVIVYPQHLWFRYEGRYEEVRDRS